VTTGLGEALKREMRDLACESEMMRRGRSRGGDGVASVGAGGTRREWGMCLVIMINGARG